MSPRPFDASAGRDPPHHVPMSFFPKKLGKGMETWKLNQRHVTRATARAMMRATGPCMVSAREPSQGATGPCLVPTSQAKVARGLAWCPLVSHRPKDAQCGYNDNNEAMKKIELILRCVMMMQRKYQTWNGSL